MADTSADYPSEFLGTFYGKTSAELKQDSIAEITLARIIKPHSVLWALIALAAALWGIALAASFLGLLNSFPGILGGFLATLAVATVVFIMSKNDAIATSTEHTRLEDRLKND